MKKTLTYLVSELVNHPDDVKIEEEKDEERTIFVIHCNSEDIGKIIGKNGRIIRALRDLVKLIAAKHDLYVDIEIAENK